MRGLAFLICAMLPGAALAEPVVLRVEAQRAGAVEAMVQRWAGRSPGVMTFPLPGGWTGIGLGPMEREAAEAELARLRAAGEIPGDSFIVPVPEGAQPVQGAGGAAAEQPPASAPAPAGAAAGASTFVPPAGTAVDTSAPASSAMTGPVENRGSAEAPAAAEPGDQVAANAAGATKSEAAEPVPAPPSGDYLRLQRFDTREAAEAALTTWRADFPEAGLFRQPDGGFAVTLGPLPAAIAEAWLGAFRAAERVGRLGAVLPAADLGAPLDPGAPIDLPGPGTASGMPPLEDVQRALRWAGHYDGEIDGKDGPQTRAAIAAEVLALRAAPDAPSAMQALIDRRAAWRAGMNLTRLDDPQSELSLTVPMDRLQFDRNEQGLSLYGPKDNSGAALILYGAPGGQQEMLDFTGLVTALGWVPSPERQVEQGHAALVGRNDTHIGQAEARVVDGRVQGVVLIWPVMDAEDQPHVAAEILDSLQATPVPEAGPAQSGPAADPA